ncbi:MAG: GNAT family N-acetyltransferase [Pseudolabrys sp.]
MTLDDGYADVPAGKLASVVTLLEMTARVALRPQPGAIVWQLRRVERPDANWYRQLFRHVGEHWLWFSRLRMRDAELSAIIHHPQVEIYALVHAGADEGLLELDFRRGGECELAFFGLAPALLGRGAGRWLMNRAIEKAWSQPIRRFSTHTCTLDHPHALDFYIRSGFTPHRRQIEIADDPRLDGTLARTAAPHVPIVD